MYKFKDEERTEECEVCGRVFGPGDAFMRYVTRQLTDHICCDYSECKLALLESICDGEWESDYIFSADDYEASLEDDRRGEIEKDYS